MVSLSHELLGLPLPPPLGGVFVKAQLSDDMLTNSCFRRRPDRGGLVALSQDRPERILRIPRRVVPISVRDHRRSVPRTISFYALHSYYFW